AGVAPRRADPLDNGIVEERAVLDRIVDPGQVLPHHGARAEVQVPDLRVAHLPLGQADRTPARCELGVAIAVPELVEHRRVRLRHRVAWARRREAEAVEHHETHRRHRRPSGPAGQAHAPAAATISAKIVGSRLAPPTSAPSTSGWARISAAFSGFTLPP